MSRRARNRAVVGRAAQAKAAPATRVGFPSTIGPPLAAAALALLCGLAYWNSFRAQLILDNGPIILQDTRLRTIDWQSVRDILTLNYWYPTFESDLFRPLTTLSYWFNYSVLGNGGNPTGYHAINLLLHWINTVLAFILVRGLTGRAWVALFAAAVLAAHPLTVESVTNIVGRADLLAGMSTLGGLCLYRRFLSAGESRRSLWLFGLAVTYVAGVFCKESAVVLPALMLLHDVVFPAVPGPTAITTARQSASRVWPAYAAVLPGVASLVWARWTMFHHSPFLGQFGTDNPIANATLWTGVMTAVKVTGYYLVLFAWPARLSSDYSYNAITLFGWTLATGQDLHAWLALAALLGLVALGVFAWRRSPAIPFFLGMAGIAFLPMSNLLFPIGTIMAERFMYVPVVGLSAAAALTLALVQSWWPSAETDRRGRGWATVRMAIAAVIVVALILRTVDRNEDWTSSVRLWTSAAEVSPESFKVYKALAFSTMESDPSGQRVDEALDFAARSIRIVEQAPLPRHQVPSALFAETGWYHLRKGQLLAARGQLSEAQTEIGKAVSLLKRAEEADRALNAFAAQTLLTRGLRVDQIHQIGNPFIYKNLGSAYLAAGDPLRAIAAVEHLQRIQPLDFESHYLRGVAEATAAQFAQQRGDQREAEVHLASAAVNLISATILNPGHAPSWEVLASVYGYLAPKPSAVIAVGGTTVLSRENPVASRHRELACAQLERQVTDAGLTDAAGGWRHRMMPSCS